MNQCAEKPQTKRRDAANLNSSFLFLLTNTELVKVPAVRVWASLHWHQFKRALPVFKNGGDKSPWGVLALCTLPRHPLSLSLSLAVSSSSSLSPSLRSSLSLSLALSVGFRAVTALSTFSLLSGESQLGPAPFRDPQ